MISVFILFIFIFSESLEIWKQRFAISHFPNLLDYELNQTGRFDLDLSAKTPASSESVTNATLWNEAVKPLKRAVRISGQ